MLYMFQRPFMKHIKCTNSGMFISKSMSFVNELLTHFLINKLVTWIFTKKMSVEFNFDLKLSTSYAKIKYNLLRFFFSHKSTQCVKQIFFYEIRKFIDLTEPWNIYKVRECFNVRNI